MNDNNPNFQEEVLYDATGEPLAIKRIKEAVADGTVTNEEREVIDKSLESLQKIVKQTKARATLSTTTAIASIVVTVVREVLSSFGITGQDLAQLIRHLGGNA